MNITEAKKKYVFTTRVDIDDENYITLREPTLAEANTFSEKDGEKNLKAIEKIFPGCVVESSFTNEAGGSATGQEIYDMLKASASLFPDVLEKWIQDVPFQSRLKKDGKSDK